MKIKHVTPRIFLLQSNSMVNIISLPQYFHFVLPVLTKILFHCSLTLKEKVSDHLQIELV